MHYVRCLFDSVFKSISLSLNTSKVGFNHDSFQYGALCRSTMAFYSYDCSPGEDHKGN
jgi:hypothetical protein